MRKIEVTAKLHSGGRRPKFVVVKNGQCHAWSGGDIAGVVQVLDASSGPKNGKWTPSHYTICVGDNTVFLELLAPLHGRVWQYASLDLAFAWFSGEVAQQCPAASPVERASFEEWLKATYPETYGRYCVAVQSDLE